MIRTVADFLEQLMKKEAEFLAKQDIKHTPTIGAMYEGLTQDLLDRAIPPGLGLEVTSGFVVDSQGHRSNQIDCMVVCSSGEVVPYTTTSKVHVDNVVAVVGVKKNLYSRDLRSGYQNLASLRPLETDGEGRSIELFKDAFQSITRHAYPENQSQLDSYPLDTQMIFHSLAVDLTYPVRIIFGYNGFASENGLRESFADYIDKGSPTNPAKGFGPARLPSLICCGHHILFKANGMPFHSKLMDDGFWPVYASVSGNPLEMLLEFVWTRLSYEARLPGGMFEGSPLGLDAHRFLDVRPVQLADSWGWRYRYIGDLPDGAPILHDPVKWEPATIDMTLQVLICKMGAEGYVDLTDPEIICFLTFIIFNN